MVLRLSATVCARERAERSLGCSISKFIEASSWLRGVRVLALGCRSAERGAVVF
jgi:hypothetical protein